MINNLFKGSYINEKEQKSYPIGTPSKGYDANGKAIPAQSSFLASNPVAIVAPPVTQAIAPPPTQTIAPPPTQTANPPATRSKYINPETGKFFQTAEEYGNYVATKIPTSKPAGDIPAYAGDAITKPDVSTTELTKTATDLNNAGNDIATGATDPYKVGNKSGIAYSPQELDAIEKAYSGIYTPALNDVFAKLKEKQASDAAEAKRISDRENQIFATNENIRQWKATTGTKSGGSSDLFTQTQLNTGARNAGITIDGFSKLDEDLQNFFVQPPSDLDELTGKSYPMNKTFDNLIKLAKSGDMKVVDAADEINSSNLPESVKHYYIDQLPLSDVEKQGFLNKIWGVVGAVGSLFGK